MILGQIKVQFIDKMGNDLTPVNAARISFNSESEEMTGNLRNWAHFLKLRLDPHAQKEVRMVAEQVAEIIKQHWPVSYEALMGVKHA